MDNARFGDGEVGPRGRRRIGKRARSVPQAKGFMQGPTPRAQRSRWKDGGQPPPATAEPQRVLSRRAVSDGLVGASLEVELSQAPWGGSVDGGDECGRCVSESRRKISSECGMSGKTGRERWEIVGARDRGVLSAGMF